MERLIRTLTCFILCALLFSCEKKELPVPEYDRGGVMTNQVELTTNYKNQVWFRLDDNVIVSTNHKADWDLGFETSVSGWHVILNTSKSMRAYKTSFNDLASVTDTVGLAMNQICDVPSGNMDSTAIGDWQSSNTVYIINRGYNELAQHQGFYKFRINAMDAGQFLIEYEKIYGSDGVHTGTIGKDNSHNFIAYSFSSHSSLNIEPAKNDFDLCFTQYTHIFHDPFQYYLVAGVLLNSYNTRALRINDVAFADISINDTIGRAFSSKWDAIGYDWKSYDIGTGVYTVYPNMCYIINDSKGFYYKLHFTDFYNSFGIKGYPTFEFKKL